MHVTETYLFGLRVIICAQSCAQIRLFPPFLGLSVRTPITASTDFSFSHISPIDALEYKMGALPESCETGDMFQPEYSKNTHHRIANKLSLYCLSHTAMCTIKVDQATHIIPSRTSNRCLYCNATGRSRSCTICRLRIFPIRSFTFEPNLASLPP